LCTAPMRTTQDHTYIGAARGRLELLSTPPCPPRGGRPTRYELRGFGLPWPDTSRPSSVCRTAVGREGLYLLAPLLPFFSLPLDLRLYGRELLLPLRNFTAPGLLRTACCAVLRGLGVPGNRHSSPPAIPNMPSNSGGLVRRRPGATMNFAAPSRRFRLAYVSNIIVGTVLLVVLLANNTVPFLLGPVVGDAPSTRSPTTARGVRGPLCTSRAPSLHLPASYL